MAMQKADEAVAELVVDITDKQKVLDAITHLQNVYPDLKVQRDGRITSLGSVKFSTSMANKLADGADIMTRVDMQLDRKPHEGVSFPPDEYVEAWPYTTVDGYKVYSDPPCFTIGTTNLTGFGVVPLANWEDAMEDHGITKEAIRAAKNHLRKNPPLHYHLTNEEK